MKTHILLLSALVLFAVPAQAQMFDKIMPSEPGDVQLSFAPLVKKAKPAVVNIYAKRVVAQRVNPFFSDDFFSGFFGGMPYGALAPRVQNSLGSGVIVRAEGLIITNAHVAGDATDIVVVLSDRREFSAVAVYVDNRSDLAVLKITPPDGEELPFLSLGDSNTLEVGDLTLAIGNPFGVGQTVTSGIVSAAARTIHDGRNRGYYIQTDAAINPGNSGGALLNMKGELIGINASIYSRDGGSLGIGFAIPANLVKTILATAENGGKNARPWFGAMTQGVTADIAQSLGIKIPSGALVRDVSPESPAAKAGLKSGDVIISVNGQEVFDEYALNYHIATLTLGQNTNLVYIREGKKIETWFTAATAPETTPRDETLLGGNNPLVGVTVVNISPAVAEEMGITLPDKGVVVKSINAQSVALRLGINIGDVLHSINGSYINSVEDVKKILTEAEGRTGWRIQYKRGEQMITAAIGG